MVWFYLKSKRISWKIITNNKKTLVIRKFLHSEIKWIKIDRQRQTRKNNLQSIWKWKSSFLNILEKGQSPIWQRIGTIHRPEWKWFSKQNISIKTKGETVFHIADRQRPESLKVSWWQRHTKAETLVLLVENISWCSKENSFVLADNKCLYPLI